MKKLVFGILLAGLFAACNSNKPHLVDAPGNNGDGSGSGDVCNVLTQTGCATGQKCTWLHDATTPTPLGHIACAPNGTAQLGASCTYGADGAMGYDNCAGGLVCQNSKCKTICDQQGGAPMCPAKFACSTYEGLFGPAGQPVAAGVCDPSCDPLTDNNFLGSGTKSGSACPQATVGCYGYPSDTNATQWSCTGEVNPTFVHRTACTGNCANAGGTPYLNGCAQGYIPLLYDMSGSTQVDCIAICAPVTTYTGNVGTTTNGPAGAAPNRCQSSDRRGTFSAVATPTGTNGEHCMYSWDFEIDTMGNFVRSPTSDTVGFCLNHLLYKYDSNKNGMIDGSDATGWPTCVSLPKLGSGTGSAHVFGGDDFACIDSVSAMLANGKAAVPENRVLVDRPHTLYHRTMTSQ